ncbi:hypothetical protein SAMN04515671_0477 [Nakamurella panacisegetis]|uniref:Lysylphosphatidylglycerol synthase TM region n=1 Tax=Nakamurella panacisegetis TaxID=1090615 RepID=A0A1H0IET0_9ACTN|nr:lysylphosphatidylglycerol synthase domain-containing protein [Nakamurella panacisegetis]SDO29902.1 hypothetical protein SAMN04515671_0477 [Nakamurella panacisegetis]
MVDGARDSADPDSEVGPPARRSLGQLLKVGFLVLVLAFAVYYVWRRHDEIGRAWSQVTVWPVVGSFLASAIAAWSGVPAWRTLLAGLGSPLRLKNAQRVFLTGQLGKYIPGGVWTVVAQAGLAKELNVPRARSGTASLMAILLGVVTASGLGALCLAVAGHQVIGHYWWVLLLAIPLLALLHPDVLVWFGATVSRLTKRNLPLERLTERSLLGAAGWLAGGQVFNGLAFYFLVDSISGHHTNPLLPIGLFALASVAGILVVFAPAGVGPRDAILLLGLSVVTDLGSATLIVLLSRVVLTVVDIALAAAAAGLGRRGRAEVSA